MFRFGLLTILVQTFCLCGSASAGTIERNTELSAILDRLDKLEKRVEVLEAENIALKSENQDIKKALNQQQQKQTHIFSLLNGSSLSRAVPSDSETARSKDPKTKGDFNQKNVQKRLTINGPAPEVAVAFRASLSKALASVGVHQAIEYDNVQLNLGNAYDARHGHFTAPMKGLYLVMANAFADPNKRVVLEMVKNGNVLTVLDTGHHTSYSSQEKSFPVVLEQNDMVWIRTFQGFAGELVPGYGGSFHNMFAAVLITAL